MTGKIITISRQFGAGGRTVARQLSETLGIPCYDKQFIAEIAAKSGLSEEYVKKEAESAESAGIFAFLGETDFYGHSNKLEIWKAQCAIIKELAAKGPCIIVGRCADYVLRDSADLLRVYLYADKEFRKNRAMTVYNEGYDNPDKFLKENDKRRKAFYDVYTDQKFGDPQNYDICLNAGSLGMEKCAEYIADIYRTAK